MRKKKNISKYLFVLPGFCFFAFAMLIPFCMGFHIAFTDWDGVGIKYNFVGLKNFQMIFQDIRVRGPFLNTLWGLCLAQAGVNVGYYVFLYTGFIKNVPISLEEAASIDGCNRYQTFFYVVFPLLKPITMTSIVLAFLASWNDFIISMIICQKLDRRTLPLMQFYFFGEYSANVNVAFAASLIAMLPAVIIYFCAQKYIVAGMTAGAVKS